MFLSGGISLFNPLEVFITTNQQDFVLHDFLGQPLDPVNIKLYIEPGVLISPSSNLAAPFSTGPLASGSRLYLVNRGEIKGIAGDAGDGGDASGYPDSLWCQPGTDGQPGSKAIDVQCNIVIDNREGYIFSGGGGGGGGAGMSTRHSLGTGLSYSHRAGSGGGGGQGLNPTSGGIDGVTHPNDVGCNNGTDGSSSAPGSGGARCNASSTAYTAYSGAGGNGGGWGQNGEDGEDSYSNANDIRKLCSGGKGGDAGKAVNLNGNIISWVGGNTVDRVKGDVG